MIDRGRDAIDATRRRVVGTSPWSCDWLVIVTRATTRTALCWLRADLHVEINGRRHDVIGASRMRTHQTELHTATGSSPEVPCACNMSVQKKALHTAYLASFVCVCGALWPTCSATPSPI